MEPCSHRKNEPLITMESVTLRMGDRMLLPGTSWEIRKFLIARTLLYSPELLILDEPCQGLDRSNRERVLALMEGIGKGTETDLIYVTHHEEELIPCIHHVLRLEKTQRTVTKGNPVPESPGPEGFRGDPQREDG